MGKYQNNNKQTYETGAKRDSSEGKGAWELIPGRVWMLISEYRRNLTTCLNCSPQEALQLAEIILYSRPDATQSLVNAASLVMDSMSLEHCAAAGLPVEHDQFYNLMPYWPMLRLAKLYEYGAKYYGGRNWEKGLPVDRTMQSARRHISQAICCMLDPELQKEDHAAAALWNIFALIYYLTDPAAKE